jgi:hypothetical protein
LCSRLEGPGTRIYDQLLGPSPGQAGWADRLEEAAARLEAMMVERGQADAELGALLASSALVWDLVLGGAGGSSPVATSLATVVEEVEKWINAAATKGV